MINSTHINKYPIPVLYFSMACNEETWNKIQSKSRMKGSIAPLVFDTLLLKGLKEQSNIKLDIYSFPSVAAFPNSNKLAWGLKKDEISPGLTTHWIPVVNLSLLKQISYFLSSFFIILLWMLRNKGQGSKQIIIYSPFLPISLAIIIFSRLTGVACTTIVTDIPKYLFLRSTKGLVNKLLKKPYIKFTELIQGRFDKYVFLTEQMNDLINIKNKPYIIIEGICDPDLFIDIPKAKEKEKAIMYAGGLNKRFGLEMLIDAFKEVKGDYQLWIFGSGDYENEIIKQSQIDQRIKYYGKVDRKIVLEHELKATLLVNLRDLNDELTKFSFPSKTMEYMCSGTPLLTTRLPGIPDEYFDYCFTLNDYNKKSMIEMVSKVMSCKSEDISNIGSSAQDFVKTNKTAFIQATRLANFLLTKQ